MAVSGPLTPGQVSFLLGIIPIFVAWVYSEWLEYKRSSSPSKVHSDNNLVELDTKTKEEDDRTVLLEGGLTKSASFKQPVASIKSNLIRFVTMEDSFLLENRATLRAMSEFGGILFFFYISDRSSLIAESAKERYNEKYGVDDALDAQSGNMSNTYRRWADHVGSKNGSYYGFGSGVDGFMLQGENDEEDFDTGYNEDFVRVQEMVEQHDIDQGTMRDQLESLKRAQEAQSRKIEELLESQTSNEQNLKKFIAQEVSKAVAQDVGKIVAQEIAKSNRQLLAALRKCP